MNLVILLLSLYVVFVVVGGIACYLLDERARMKGMRQ